MTESPRLRMEPRPTVRRVAAPLPEIGLSADGLPSADQSFPVGTTVTGSTISTTVRPKACGRCTTLRGMVTP